MKQLLILSLLVLSTKVFAQNVNGKVIDSITKLSISNAQINNKGATVFTNDDGKFTLINVAIGDQISFRILGYETLELKINGDMFNQMLIATLKPQSIDLKEVKIKTNRNYRKDSLDLRKEYASAFNYKAPKLTDAFIKVDPNHKSPHANINPNSTASILKLNILQLASLIGKNKAPSSKLKQTLIRDEQENYIDQKFSKSKVEGIVDIKADSLQMFMQRYRPTYKEARQMNEYEIILYIKRCYVDFLKPN